MEASRSFEIGSRVERSFASLSRPFKERTIRNDFAGSEPKRRL